MNNKSQSGVLKKEQTQQEGSIPLLHRIKKIIHHHDLLKPDEKIIVGVSGGADSLALMHILHALDWGPQMIAVYIDHGLRPEEIQVEKQAIKKYCRDLHIPFISESVNVTQYAASTKCSIEEAARILRHEALEEIRSSQFASSIILAHTADDQVEEFFIRLMRGTSLKGLSGMQLKRDHIIRPLLNEPKTALIHYLEEAGVPFCFDSSNLNRQYLRNRIRLDLLPKLENEYNPSIRQTILQNMDILARDENFLEEVSSDALEQCVSYNSENDGKTTENRLILLPEPLRTFHYAIQCRVIERCFWIMKIKPGYLKIRSLLHFAQSAENSTELHLADGIRVTKSLNQIILSRPLRQGQLRGSVPVDTFPPLQIPGPGCYTIKEIGKKLKLSISSTITTGTSNSELLFLDREKVTFPLHLRPPNPGERFRPYNAPGKKKIVRYLSERKIEVKKRSGYPVLVSGSKVIALPGLQISHEVRVTGATKSILTVELFDMTLGGCPRIGIYSQIEVF